MQKGKVKNLVGTRGRTFKGEVIRKFSKRVVIEFDRTVKIKKYERFAKKKKKLHARILEGLEVHEGDYIRVEECKPLSKIVNFVVKEVLRKAGK